jgi:hypothetical protein
MKIEERSDEQLAIILDNLPLMIEREIQKMEKLEADLMVARQRMKNFSDEIPVVQNEILRRLTRGTKKGT